MRIILRPLPRGGGARRRRLERTFDASVVVTAAGYVRSPRRRRAGLRLTQLSRFTCAAGPAPDCDPRTIRRAAKEGKISAFRINEEFRFDPAAVRLALSNNARSRK